MCNQMFSFYFQYKIIELFPTPLKELAEDIF